MPFDQHRVGSVVLAVLVFVFAGLLAACEQTAEHLPASPPSVGSGQPAVAVTGSAQQRFSAVKLPAALAGPSVIGGYARGCLARAQGLPLDGPHWQVMRTSRNRYWGHPTLIAFIKALADRENQAGWNGLLVGDLGQPRGGPAPTGHASHQIGLDVDIWLTPMPATRYTNAQRETTPAASMLRPQTIKVDTARFTRAQASLIKRAAEFDEVERIFVNPGIKKALCDGAGSDRDWLAKVRPWPGHDAHMHVRLRCPAGEGLCEPQDAPPPGDGCGAELTSWLKSTDWLKPGPEPVMKATPMSALPATCTQVVEAPDVQQTAVNR